MAESILTQHIMGRTETFSSHKEFLMLRILPADSSAGKAAPRVAALVKFEHSRLRACLTFFLVLAGRMTRMQAATLNCPNCGAASFTEAPWCQFCGSRLATVACPSCFAMMFIGSKHCQRCGATAAVPEIKDSKDRKCPRCQTEMVLVTIGATMVLECEQCLGLWLDVPSFEKICADREQQSAVLGVASQAPTSAAHETSKVNYVPCPECSQLMNRMNFARCSGVIVDVCKKHGTWFDRDELSRIVEFIHGGGLNASRAKEKIEIAEQRERLRQEQLVVEMHDSATSGIGDWDDHRLTGIASTRGLLKFLLQ
jgi:Zn-finger nucleic acid-binding protein